MRHADVRHGIVVCVQSKRYCLPYGPVLTFTINGIMIYCSMCINSLINKNVILYSA